MGVLQLAWFHDTNKYRNKHLSTCVSSVLYMYIYIGGLGELVQFIRPPVTGRLASFRLRFRFVRAVRASEAKLCGRMWNVILNAGPPGS